MFFEESSKINKSNDNRYEAILVRGDGNEEDKFYYLLTEEQARWGFNTEQIAVLLGLGRFNKGDITTTTTTTETTPIATIRKN